MLRRHLSSDRVDSVRVGRAATRLRNGGDFKPVGALATLPPRLGATLEWLCQKDALGQDALLICAPAERARAHARACSPFFSLPSGVTLSHCGYDIGTLSCRNID